MTGKKMNHWTLEQFSTVTSMKYASQKKVKGIQSVAKDPFRWEIVSDKHQKEAKDL